MSEDSVLELVKNRQGNRSLREYAKDIGCSAAYLSDILRGNRSPGPIILGYLNLKRTVKTIVTYQTIKKQK